MQKINMFMKLRSIAYFTFMLCVSLLTITAITGCSGTFLAEASSVLEIVIAAFTGLSGALVAFDPALAGAVGIVSTILKDAMTEVQNIESLVEQYKVTPDETLLDKIEAGIQLVTQNIQPLLTGAGLPAALAAKVAAIAQEVLTQLEAWASLFPAAKPAAAPPAAAAAAHVLSAAHVTQKVVVIKPVKAEVLRARISAILAEPTGDAKADAAFAHVKV